MTRMMGLLVVLAANVVVACASGGEDDTESGRGAATKGPSGGNAKEEPRSDDKTSRADKKPEESPAAATPTPAGTGGETSLPAADPCTQQCIGSNAVAEKIRAAADLSLECHFNCTDNACFDKCDRPYGQACQANAAACQIYKDCNKKCFVGGFDTGAK